MQDQIFASHNFGSNVQMIHVYNIGRPFFSYANLFPFLYAITQQQ